MKSSPRPRDRRHRRAALAVSCLAVLLASCGSDDESSSTSTAVSVSASSSPSTDPPTTTATAESTAPVSDASPSDEPPPSDGPPAGTAAITHDYGTSEVPLDPQQVLALENRRDLETAVVLDLPIGAVGAFGGGNGGSDVAADFVPVDLTGVEIIDTAELNLEQIAALQPDLILAREIYLDDGESDQLAQIAPILPIADDGPWRTDLEQVAGWLQREDLLADALAEYDGLLTEVRDRHAEHLDTPVAIVEYYAPDQTFYAGGIDDFQLQANTLGELGGTLVPFLTDRDYFAEPFSVENLGELSDAGAILLVSNSQDERDALAANPLWQQLPAVQEGRIVVTDTRTNQGSVYAATESLHLLDQLYSTMQ